MTTATHNPADQNSAIPAHGIADFVYGVSRPDFEVFFDMSKAVEDKADGKIWISGIASDQSEDLDGEIVKAASYPNSISYLKSFGKFNWDHRPNSIIGDITEANFITPEEAQDKYGVMVKGMAVELRGWIMPLSVAPDDSNLREAHKMLKSGSKLGFSMQGNYGAQRVITTDDGRKVTVAIPSFVYQVAVCPQPKNFNSACFVKSLAKVLLPENGNTDAQAPGENSWPVVICSNGVCQTYEKAIAMDGSLALDGTTGGNAIKLQSLAGPGIAEKTAGKKKACSCGGSHEDDDDDKDNGASEVSAALQQKKDIRALRKSIFSLLDMASAIIRN